MSRDTAGVLGNKAKEEEEIPVKLQVEKEKPREVEGT